MGIEEAGFEPVRLFFVEGPGPAPGSLSSLNMAKEELVLTGACASVPLLPAPPDKEEEEEGFFLEEGLCSLRVPLSPAEDADADADADAAAVPELPGF